MSFARRVQHTLRITSPRRMYFYSVLIGLLAGLGAVAIAYLIAFVQYFLFDTLAGMPMKHAAGAVKLPLHAPATALGQVNPFVLFFLPVVGGLVVGLLVRFVGKDVAGPGTDDLIAAFHHREGKVPGRSPLAKTVGTAVTLGTGGSGGKEGPVAYIGAGLGSWIASLLNAGPRARRTLLLAGTAGGLGAIFHAPLGGAMVAVEVLYREDIESDSLVPAILSSVTAYLTFTAIVGPGSLLHVPDIGLDDYSTIPIYAVLGLVCYAFGYIYVKVFHTVRRGFEKLPVHPILKPALGGVFVGCMALAFPEVIGEGMGFLQELLLGGSPSGGGPLQIAGVFLLLGVLKVLATSFTIGSGGSGGLFGPSLFIGAMLGGFVGSIAQWIFPGWDLQTAPFMLVGMGALFAGVARAPFASMIMVCDVIGSYKLLPPLMIVSMIAFILSHRWSLYQNQIHNRFKSPAHFWDMQLDVLEQLRIGQEFPEYRQRAIVDKSMLLSELENIAIELQASDFVVRDADGGYYGMVSLKKTRISQADMQSLRGLITVEDAADVSAPALQPGDSLSRALRVITEYELDKVAVVDEERRLLGYVRYNEIFTAYRRRLRLPENQPEGPLASAS